MTGPELQTLAQILTERMLNSAAEGVIVGGAAWCLLRLTRQNANARFAIWFAALLAIVALPFYRSSREARSLVPGPSQLHGGVVLSSSWAVCLFAAWALVASLLLLRLCMGVWRLHQLRSDCAEVRFADLAPEVAEIFQEFSKHHRVQLFTSNDVTVPSAIGFLRPAIIFPSWLLPRLSTEEIRVILPHELAHLRRRDPWTNLFQKTAKALFFFHPAVWWIDNRLTLEREMACDDVVLAQAASPRAYAQFLISFAEKLQNARSIALAQALLNRMHHLSLRVAQVLDAKRPVSTGFWKPALRLSAGLLALVIGTAPYVPQLVSIENHPRKQTQPVQTAKEETHLVSPIGNVPPAMTATVVHTPATVKKLRAIPVALNTGARTVPPRPEERMPGKSVAMRARAASDKTSGQAETFVIVQTVSYDNSGWVRTLTIWKVRRGTSAERQMESVISLTI